VESAINVLRGKHPLATVMVTGHSLGGALGVMAAAHIQNKYRLVEMLYTVGQPRVGNDKFAQFMGTFVPETYRIVDYADQIVHIPQSILGFKHFGWEAWYQRGMQEYKICPSESKDCSNQLGLLKMNQADHKIVLYL
jgi:pimeloyl-ACP methyl ester carboxylesterase